MRAFIALCVPAAAKAAARAYQDRWKECWAGRPVSWTRDAGFHLTLRFLGDIEPKIAGVIAERLAVLGDLPPIPCAFTAPLGFPDLRKPFILALDVAGPPALLAIADDLDRVLKGLRLEKRDKAFRPHLTLGRVRDRQATAPEAPDFGEAVPWEATRVALFRSELSPAGSRYEALAEVTLSAPRPAGS